MVRTIRHMPLRLIRDARPAPPPPGLSRPVAEHPDTRLVSRDFLTAMGTRVVSGRGFGPADGPGQPRVLLINQALARTGFLGPEPVGGLIYIIDRTPWQVIGIVEDIRQTGLAAEADPQFPPLPASPGSAGGRRRHLFRGADQRPAGRHRVHRSQPRARADPRQPGRSRRKHGPNCFAFAVQAPVLCRAARRICRDGGRARDHRDLRHDGLPDDPADARDRQSRKALGARRGSCSILMLRQGGVMAGLGITAGLAGALALTSSLGGMLSA